MDSDNNGVPKLILESVGPNIALKVRINYFPHFGVKLIVLSCVCVSTNFRKGGGAQKGLVNHILRNVNIDIIK